MKVGTEIKTSLEYNSGISPKGKIGGIKDYIYSQRLKYKVDTNPDDDIDFAAKLASGEAYEATTNDQGIAKYTEQSKDNKEIKVNNNYNLLIPPESLSENINMNFHKHPFDLINLNDGGQMSPEEVKKRNYDTQVKKALNEGLDLPPPLDATINDDYYNGEDYNQIAEIQHLDIAYGSKIPNQKQEAVLNNGIHQVLKSNTMEEFVDENLTSFFGNSALGKAANTVAGGLIGGVASQALNTWNQGANLVNGIAEGLGGNAAIPTVGNFKDDPLYTASTKLVAEKNAYEKSINVAYANSKLYNRLTNLANDAAGAANPFSPNNFNATGGEGFLGGLGGTFNNWVSNTLTGSKQWMNANAGELLELNTANFVTMSTTMGLTKPEISIKRDPNPTTNFVANYDPNKISSLTKADASSTEMINPYEPSIENNDYRNNESTTKQIPFLNGGLSFKMNREQNTPKIFFGTFLSDLKTLLPSFLTSVREEITNDDNISPEFKLVKNIQFLKSNAFIKTLEYDNYGNLVYNGNASNPYSNLESNFKSEEELSQINVLKDKNNFIKELGYLYVRPYPNDYKFSNEPYSFEPFTIPFEFSPKIDEGALQAKYAAEDMLNRIGTLRTYINTEPGTVTIETEYLALCEDMQSVFNLRQETVENEDGTISTNTLGGSYNVSKNFGVDAWQYYWDVKMIERLELMYRSLVMPTNVLVNNQPGILKPPMIKILLQTDKEKEMTVGNLYRYPYQTSSDGYNYFGDKNMNPYYMQNATLDYRDSGKFRTYKTYIATDVKITYDEEKHIMKFPSHYKTRQEFENDSSISLNMLYKLNNGKTNESFYRIRGFKVNISLVEIAENYLDTIPDFATYYVTSVGGTTGKNTKLSEAADHFNTSFDNLNSNLFAGFVSLTAFSLTDLQTKMFQLDKLNSQINDVATQTNKLKESISEARRQKNTFEVNNGTNIALAKDYEEALGQKEALEIAAQEQTDLYQTMVEQDELMTDLMTEVPITTKVNIPSTMLSDEQKEYYRSIGITETADGDWPITPGERMGYMNNVIMPQKDEADKATNASNANLNKITELGGQMELMGLFSSHNDGESDTLADGTVINGFQEWQFLLAQSEAYDNEISDRENNVTILEQQQELLSSSMNQIEENINYTSTHNMIPNTPEKNIQDMIKEVNNILTKTNEIANQHSVLFSTNTDNVATV